MASYGIGKSEIARWARKIFNQGATCLDVGACDGKWFDIFCNDFHMDAVEIFEPNIEKHRLEQKYDYVFHGDIIDYKYDWYDFIIFGDVIEHMTVEHAQKVLEYAYPRCRDMVIAVPYLWSQPEIYGNKWEIHIQNDLTDKIFHERYKGFEPIIIYRDYGYYHKKP